MPIYAQNGALLADGNALRGCCCGPATCLEVRIGVRYYHTEIDGGNDFCTVGRRTNYTRASDLATATAASSGAVEAVDAGSCKLGSGDVNQNYVYNPPIVVNNPWIWDYDVHQAKVLQPGTVDTIRYHLHSPASARNYFWEFYNVLINIWIDNVRVPAKVTWKCEMGQATGSCSAASCTWSEHSSGVFSDDQPGDWTPQDPSYSYMGATGGWYLKQFSSGVNVRYPVSTRFTFKVEAL